MSNEKRKAEMLDKMLIYLFEKYSFDEAIVLLKRFGFDEADLTNMELDLFIKQVLTSP